MLSPSTASSAGFRRGRRTGQGPCRRGAALARSTMAARDWGLSCRRTACSGSARQARGSRGWRCSASFVLPGSGRAVPLCASWGRHPLSSRRGCRVVCCSPCISWLVRVSNKAVGDGYAALKPRTCRKRTYIWVGLDVVPRGFRPVVFTAPTVFPALKVCPQCLRLRLQRCLSRGVHGLRMWLRSAKLVAKTMQEEKEADFELQCSSPDFTSAICFWFS